MAIDVIARAVAYDTAQNVTNITNIIYGDSEDEGLEERVSTLEEILGGITNAEDGEF